MDELKFRGKSLSYFRARQVLSVLAEEKGFKQMSRLLQSSPGKLILGKDEEELNADAFLSPRISGEKTPRMAIVIMAGIHGAEAPAGVIMLCRFLKNLEKLNLPFEMGIALVVPNPYGFSFNQRGGHDGGDVNRGCSFPNTSTPNFFYDDLKDLVEPEMLDWNLMERIQKQVSDFPRGPGWAEVQQKIIRGQYHSPKGLFYGGDGKKLCWSGEFVRDLCNLCFQGVEKMFVLDIHTGLGPKNVGTILSPLASKETDDADRVKNWFGEKEVNFPNTKDNCVSGAVYGDILSAITRWLPNTQVTPIALEMGTTSPLVSFPAKVGKMWLRNHPEKIHLVDPELVKKIHEDYRLTFSPIEDDVWMKALSARFFGIIESAVKGLLRV